MAVSSYHLKSCISVSKEFLGIYVWFEDKAASEI